MVTRWSIFEENKKKNVLQSVDCLILVGEILWIVFSFSSWEGPATSPFDDHFIYALFSYLHCVDFFVWVYYLNRDLVLLGE